MRASLGLVGLLIAVLIGWLIYSSQIKQTPNNQSLIQQTNSAAVRTDLLSLGQSERLYLSANGSYATLEQLQSSGVMSSFPDGSRSGYRYTAEVDGAAHFRITASPADLSRTDLPTLSIDETLQIAQ
jgi:hypothetical protein